ncbi:MAG: efflux RND transporter periplasmic adaptor subunit [Fibrobacterota bacterium]
MKSKNRPDTEISSLLITALAFFMILLSGCGGRAAPEPIAEVVRKRDIIRKISVVGTLLPRISIDLKSEVAGRVTEVVFEEGDALKKGETVFKIDTQPYINRLAKARLDLRSAKLRQKKAERDYRNKKGLLAKGGVSRVELEDAEIEMEISAIALNKEEINVKDILEDLERTSVTSPIDGILIDSDVEEGEIVSSASGGLSSGTLMGKVAKLDDMEISTEITEVDYKNVNKGDTVIVRSMGEDDHTFKGIVSFVSSSARDSDNGGAKVFDVKVNVISDSRELMPGINVIVDFIIGMSISTPSLPFEFITVKDKKQYVFKSEAGNPEEVETGMDDGIFIELLDGPAPGDTVYKIPGEAELKLREFKKRNKSTRRGKGRS